MPVKSSLFCSRSSCFALSGFGHFKLCLEVTCGATKRWRQNSGKIQIRKYVEICLFRLFVFVVVVVFWLNLSQSKWSPCPEVFFLYMLLPDELDRNIKSGAVATDEWVRGASKCFGRNFIEEELSLVSLLICRYKPLLGLHPLCATARMLVPIIACSV